MLYQTRIAQVLEKEGLTIQKGNSSVNLPVKTKSEKKSLKKNYGIPSDHETKSFIWRCIKILCQTGAYKKLKKTLKKTPRKDTSKKEPVKKEPVEIVDESMVISDDEEDVVEVSGNNEEENKEESGDEFDTTVEMEEGGEDGEVQD